MMESSELMEASASAEVVAAAALGVLSAAFASSGLGSAFDSADGVNARVNAVLSRFRLTFSRRASALLLPLITRQHLDHGDL